MTDERISFDAVDISTYADKIEGTTETTTDFKTTFPTKDLRVDITYQLGGWHKLWARIRRRPWHWDYTLDGCEVTHTNDEIPTYDVKAKTAQRTSP